VAQALASIDLLLLILVGLTVALLETPVPRVWAIVAGVLLSVQAYAVHQMELQPLNGPHSGAIVHTTAEAVATLAVPALTAALLTVVFFHLARAYARARRRLEAAWAARVQAIGSDMPTGWGGAEGTGSCITGSSTGESATSPRAA
jgi:hypothetical protein